MAGGGSSDNNGGSSAFSRSGGTTLNESYGYGPQLQSLITGNLNSTSAQDAAPKTFLSRMVSMDSSMPGFAGQTAGASLNPFSSTYETSTQGLYENRLQQALMKAQSGMENVVAPLERGKSLREQEVINEFARGRNREIRDERNVDSDIMLKSIESMLGQRIAAANAFSPLKMSDQAAFMTAAQLLGNKTSSSSESYSGQGNQSSQATSFGGGVNFCCFIMLQGLNGTLPWWVRVCRDTLVDEKSCKGYRKMSKWLVPAMRTWPWVQRLINFIMVHPITKLGGWMCGVKGYEKSWVYKPVFKLWFTLWTLMGEE